jgi:hypothetical protein
VNWKLSLEIPKCFAVGISVKDVTMIARRFVRVHLLAYCFLTMVCLSSSFKAQERPSESVTAEPVDLAGKWGGLHLAMSVTTKGATLEFDCAHGQLDKLLPRNVRRFALRGTYVQEHGGPLRKGEVSNSQAALYTGAVKGNQMTISVRLLDTGQQIGTFVVTRGEPARLVKCK